MNIEKMQAVLAVYGYTLQDLQIVTKFGKNTGVIISEKRGRLQCRNGDKLLWSGVNLGDFVKAYWCATLV